MDKINFQLEVFWAKEVELEDRRKDLKKLDRHIFNLARSSYPFPIFKSEIVDLDKVSQNGYIKFELSSESKDKLDDILKTIKKNYSRVTITGEVSEIS